MAGTETLNHILDDHLRTRAEIVDGINQLNTTAGVLLGFAGVIAAFGVDQGLIVAVISAGLAVAAAMYAMSPFGLPKLKVKDQETMYRVLRPLDQEQALIKLIGWERSATTTLIDIARTKRRRITRCEILLFLAIVTAVVSATTGVDLPTAPAPRATP